MTATAVAYGFRNVSFIYDGQKLDGFYEGDDSVTLTPNNPLITTVVGSDGKGVWNLGADRSAKLTLKLLKSSSANTLLATDLALLSVGQFSAKLVSINSTHGDFIAGGFFAVTSFPEDTKFGQKDDGVTWTLETTSLDIFPGRVGQIIAP